jgi:Flp pilus assembly protein TadD
MVPFEGGEARLMTCNTPRMNSWHTFSPNGRWMAFSSKGRSPYTQLMITHIDAEGHDSPSIMVENTTAANRAVNIPEFVNIPQGGMEKIDPQATEFYRLFNDAYDAFENNQFPQAIEYLRAAVARDPDDPLGHFILATALTANGQERDALAEYRKASDMNPKNAAWLDHLAVSLANNDEVDAAIEAWHKSLELNPADGETETDLGMVLFNSGRKDEGLQHLQKAVTLGPDLSDAHNHLGVALADLGKTEAAVEELQKAVELYPKSAEFQFNLGYVLESRSDYAAALKPLEQSVELGEGKNGHCLVELAKVYAKLGRTADALRTGHKALELAEQQHNEQLATSLRAILASYERENPNAPSH